jgi:DNA topoisomerase-1
LTPRADRRLQRAARLHDDPRAAAAAAGPTYVTPDAPGFTRARHGRGFSYRGPDGRLADAVQRRRIAALAIPPAWTDVWICALDDGHLQCTGLDAKGRKQYRYHERWRAVRDAAGFDRLAVMGTALPAIRAEVTAQLRRRTVDRPRVLAGMVRLLDRTGIRIGNEIYERENSSIGLTTLRWAHVRLTGDTVELRFPAKSGIRSEIVLADAALARLLTHMASGRRQRVFRCDGAPLHADDLNGYLDEIAGVHITAKDFRTWLGTVTALARLAAMPSRQRSSRRSAIAAIDSAADALGNTRAVARAHYVHPGLIAAAATGALSDLPAPPAIDGLRPEEQTLLELLPRLPGPVDRVS